MKPVVSPWGRSLDVPSSRKKTKGAWPALKGKEKLSKGAPRQRLGLCLVHRAATL